MSGGATVGTTLAVTGATALNGGLTMDTSKFVVADTSGNTTIGGTLNVAGASVFTGAVTQVATPVWAHAATSAPTNSASQGLVVTVNGTNYVLALYPN